MAGPAPKTKDWTARENAHKPKGLHVIVAGLVEVSATNKEPELKEAPSVGSLLVLDLTVRQSAQKGTKVVVWKQAYFHKEVSANQYERVEIRAGKKHIATMPVIDDQEHNASMAKQTAAQNTVAAAKRKKTTAKKVVDAVKGAVKKVKRAAKTIAKKVTKKAAKKAARKASKSSARRPVKTSAKRSGKKARAVKRPARKAKRR